MEKQLQAFLDKAFAPYGDFPARADVIQELQANLVEKYNDFKQHGKSDDQAYQLTIDSFGDVSEIMEQLPHTTPATADQSKSQPSLYKTIVNGIKEAASANGTAPKASNLEEADLTDSDLAGKDFSMSALMGARFDRSNLSGTTFKATALKGASFVEANLQGAAFRASELRNADFSKADLTNVTFHASDFNGAVLGGATLVNTQFSKSDLTGIVFDDIVLDGVVFNSSSLHKASFKGAVLRNVSFHHAAVKQAIFDGATMDKLTYALLKGAKATLTDVVVQ